MAPQGQLKCESGEWKPRSEFSKSQLAKYEKKRAEGLAKPDNSGIRCNVHTSKPVQQMECEDCGRKRELRYFSKNSRRNGFSRCIDCTEYYVRLEPGQYLPHPADVLLPGERVLHGGVPAESENDSDVLALNDFGEIVAALPATNTTSNSTWNSSSTSDSTSTVPPVEDEWHQDAFGAVTDWEAAEASTSWDSYHDDSDLDDLIPPHLRGPNPEYRCQRRPVTFDNWDYDYDELAASIVNKRAAGPSHGRSNGKWGQPSQASRRNGWAKAPTRKTPQRLPEYLKGGFFPANNW